MLSLLSAKDNLRVGFRIAPVDFLAGCCLRLDYTFGGLLLRGFCMNNGGDRCGCVNFIIPFYLEKLQMASNDIRVAFAFPSAE